MSEKTISKKGLDEFKKKIESEIENKSFKKEIIRRTLHDKEELRKCFLSIIQTSPARFNDIDEKLFCGRATTYRYIYKLISLGLVKKISIMDIWNKTNLTDEQKEVMKKFDNWTKTMKEGMKQYFGAKTNYFILTELAMDEELLNWAMKCELDMKGGEEK